jgi:DNA sulfur modification protein DndE
MKPPLEHVGVSQRSRDILITLKRRTGIANWNILCRWAFCDSLANQNRPVPVHGPADSNIDMSWDTFAGDFSEVLLAMFYQRAAIDDIPQTKATMAAYFRDHLERGISQLERKPPLALEAIIVLRQITAYSVAPEHMMQRFNTKL